MKKKVVNLFVATLTGIFLSAAVSAGTDISSSAGSEIVEGLQSKSVSVAKTKFSLIKNPVLLPIEAYVFLGALAAIGLTADFLLSDPQAMDTEEAHLKDKAQLDARAARKGNLVKVETFPYQLAKNIQTLLVEKLNMHADNELATVIKQRGHLTRKSQLLFQTSADFVLRINPDYSAWKLGGLSKNYKLDMVYELINTSTSKVLVSFPCYYKESEDGIGLSSNALRENNYKRLLKVHQVIEAACLKEAQEIVAKLLPAIT